MGLSFRFCFSFSNNPCESVFIRVPKKFGVLSSEFGVKGDKILILILGTLGTPNSRNFLFCVHLCPIYKFWLRRSRAVTSVVKFCSSLEKDRHLFCLKGCRIAPINAEKYLWLDRILKICVHLRPNHLFFSPRAESGGGYSSWLLILAMVSGEKSGKGNSPRSRHWRTFAIAS